MIATKENQRLYPATWEYNAARITTELAKIVVNNGGRVKYGNAAIISNRSIQHAIFEKENRIEQLKRINAETFKEARTAAIKALEKEIDELKQIDNAPRRVTHTGYIQFVFENNYYYFQTDNNPFFPFYYIKTPLKNNKYSADACCTEDKKEWLFDCFFSWNCSDADIKEAANLIFNMLCTAPFSEIMRDQRRERVPNRYNSGYHYETIYAPERIKEIDF
jgi:hypothetical protein